MGGDEFCVLVEGDRHFGVPLVEQAATALSERGASFELGASYGMVFLPEEATSVSEALRITDQRMYRQKWEPWGLDDDADDRGPSAGAERKPA